jgi:WD40 repeat protein
MLIFNLGTNKIVKEIKNCHNKHITNFRHILDKKESRDLVMSVSSEENNIKIWEVKTWECISNLEKINYKGLIYSACFYSDLNNNIHVVSSNRNKAGDCEPIKIFDLNGYIIQEMEESKEQTYFIDIYLDETLNKNFIITGNVGLVKSYDISQNKLYHTYCENNELNNFCHFSVVVRNINNKSEMIESCFDGFLRIWEFHVGNLVKKIKVSNEGLRGICIYDENILFVGCDDKKIKVVDIETKNVILNLSGHSNEVISIKKFKHEKFGECIASQNGGESSIYLWKIE